MADTQNFRIEELLRKYQKDKNVKREFINDLTFTDNLPKINWAEVWNSLESFDSAIKASGAGLCFNDALQDALMSEERKTHIFTNAKSIKLSMSCRTRKDYELMLSQIRSLRNSLAGKMVMPQLHIIMDAEQYYNIMIKLLAVFADN